MTEQLYKETEQKMNNALELLTKEFSGIRTGRASIGLLDSLKVEYYNTLVPINQVATISIPDVKSILIQPWDPSVLQKVEKAILKSDLGLVPINDGKIIRLNIPTLTEERRKQLAKHTKKLTEDAKVAIRNIRRDANDKLKNMEKEKLISEDETRKGQERIQKITDKLILKADEIYSRKETEIMEI